MNGTPEYTRLVTGEVISSADRTAPAVDAGRSSDAEMSSTFPVENPSPSRRKAGPVLFWSTCLLAVFLVFWMSGGHRLVLEPLARTIRNAPSQALQIENVTSRVERAGANSHLLVEGAVRNHGEAVLSLPPIIIAVTETDGPTARYFLETGETPLASGAQYGFSSRLDAPANGVASVSITFQEGSR